MTECIEILSPGVGCSIQDAGRPGWRRFGVPPGGAMDRFSMRSANRLLGNRPDAPVLELLMQGQKLRLLEDTWVALAGGDLGASLKPWSAECLPAGKELHCLNRYEGLWSYLAVPGGFEVPRWFGSASTDARNGLGQVLRNGDCLRSVGSSRDLYPGVQRRLSVAEDRRSFSAELEFELLPGPQFDSFAASARAVLVELTWTISSRSDRTGYRLKGPALEVPASIPSEPVLPGSFQITGSGQPIITMTDGPTVGGYAKLAVLKEADLDRLAQCAPGTQLRFRWA
ncbi:MAG: biotin-dependent carboxyltransferase family protein [Verrucomicrobiota bacterium]